MQRLRSRIVALCKAQWLTASIYFAVGLFVTVVVTWASVWADASWEVYTHATTTYGVAPSPNGMYLLGRRSTLLVSETWRSTTTWDEYEHPTPNACDYPNTTERVWPDSPDDQWFDYTRTPVQVLHTRTEEYNEYVQRWKQHVASGNRREQYRDDWFFWGPALNPNRTEFDKGVFDAGFPLRSMRRRLSFYDSWRADLSWADAGIDLGLNDSARRTSIFFPCAPRPGMLVDGVFWGGLAFATIRGPAILRSKSRIRRGICVRCKYDLLGIASPTCPECGSAIPSKATINT